MIRLPILCFLAVTIACQSGPEFDLNGASTVEFINRTHDSVRVKIEDWQIIPLKSIISDTIIAPNSHYVFSLNPQSKSYYTCTIGKSEYQLFTYPGSIDIVELIENSTNPTFRGSSSEINRYLLNKHLSKLSSSEISKLHSWAINNAKSYDELLEINDSIHNVLSNHLLRSQSEIPSWYFEYELNRLKYISKGAVLKSLTYRNRILGIIDSLPPNSTQKLIENLEIDNQIMIGDEKYVNFLNALISQLAREQNAKNLNSPFSERVLDIATTNLKGLNRDIYFAVIFCFAIDRGPYMFDTDQLSLIQDSQIRSLLTHYHTSSIEQLQADILPEFNLIGSNGLMYNSSDFKGKYLLVNFWATWCKPCYLEFPHEDSLVVKYQNSPVEIINICIESDYEEWKKVVTRNGLITTNLFSSKKWESIFKLKYTLQALPHSILVDTDGTIIDNNCPRASQNISSTIDHLLEENRR